MKDYKRLTTMNEKGEWTIELNEELKLLQRNLPADEFVSALFDLTAQRLCDIEDKIENGSLIELPYKLGTELHFIVFNRYSGEFEVFTTEFWAYVSRYKDEFGGVEFAIEIIDVDFDNGTLIEVCHFLTKAEAEAKLRELKGEQQWPKTK